MKIAFVKYQGTGNDFIIIDNRQRQYDHLNVALLCHPKFGIGADGLMLLQNHPDFDFEMVYYNSDGNTSSMCGNGGRCIVDFAKRLHVFDGHQCRFIAIDGPHDAVWQEEHVELKMMDVLDIEQRLNDCVLNTGSPHYVVFTDDVKKIDILHEAREIRYDEEFKQHGINVNFVELVNDTKIKVRTYERGVENETLSCGTGVTACSIASVYKQNLTDGHHNIEIETPGGTLNVKFEKGEGGFKNVWLCGPATEVFEGMINFSHHELPHKV
jgi:diaminopimelate epimerase